ncbi:MAG: rRNA pseudouridine synthase [Desulfarculus sp.]|nr:rRNA pseudouridine synthase [Pseudomonadota bacterium]MBV1715185.1 rRNA pseudouridine synthase [Desulfarculus sp.]MBU4574489.1 rRNA pseudouridine synthase [Pseudomonadota bacterium]MBU4598268.1 rRNA pseudouridine synthase [Pseudomonadota bacterium]MBV1736683.1 rRNA pseudouridine synthase [Desulfarculus sp.]
MPKLRLHKILAQAGVASRRAAEDMIAAGRVAVDGKVMNQPGDSADPAAQKITIDGKPLPQPEQKEYWMIHKPSGVVSTVSDPQGRRTVLSLLPPEAAGRLYPVGRLDYYSEGLLLMTNDGELFQRLTHPSHQVPKRYLVWVDGRPGPAVLQRLRTGVEIEGGKTAPAKVGIKSSGKNGSKLSFLLTEGRKREIRRMCVEVGHRVQRLVRVGIGPLRLGDLPLGEARRLRKSEIFALREAAGLKDACKPSDDGVQKTPHGKAEQTGGRRRKQSPRRIRD